MYTVEVDFSVAVAVGLADHGIYVMIGERLAEVGHRLPQFFGVDKSVAVDVENAERLTQLGLLASPLGLIVVARRRLLPPRHHRQELFELDGAVTCRQATSSVIFGVLARCDLALRLESASKRYLESLRKPNLVAYCAENTHAA